MENVICVCLCHLAVVSHVAVGLITDSREITEVCVRVFVFDRSRVQYLCVLLSQRSDFTLFFVVRSRINDYRFCSFDFLCN